MAKDLKIVYLISAYKLPEQLIDLVKQLQSPNDLFLIHVDRKTPKKAFNIIRNALSEYDNVIFISRHECNWGDFGHVRATLKGMEYVVDNKNLFTHFVVLTGQDFPIYSMSKTRSLISHAGNSMEYFKMPSKQWDNGGMDRLTLFHYWIRRRYFVKKMPGRECLMKKIVRAANTDSNKASYYGGSSYFQLDKSAVEYVVSFIRKHPEFVRFFKHAFISDEIFFQTILLNSNFASKIRNESRRYVDWSDPKESPKILRSNDISRIRKSNAIFARKFDIDVDPMALELIKSGNKS